jgi:hypothetical protein
MVHDGRPHHVAEYVDHVSGVLGLGGRDETEKQKAKQGAPFSHGQILLLI